MEEEDFDIIMKNATDRQLLEMMAKFMFELQKDIKYKSSEEES